MKNPLFAVVTVLGIAACSSAQASKLNPNDDLHCSVVSFYFARSDRTMSDLDARTLFVVSAWYNKQIGNKVDLGKAGPVLQKVKDDPVAARPVAADCIQRASRDPGFEGFARDATEAWNQVAEAGSPPNR